ncbi:MAG TPA: hypothetical protein VMM60_17490 [Ilumatobacter sp.]|nr:hypothetical protein [Ilumatobacter sp.]
MACLTITVDSDVLERAHMQAAISGVPVKQIVREALAEFAEGNRTTPVAELANAAR